MAETNIEWATHTWNPTTGCDRVSPGCDHCYALTLAKRLKGMGSAKYQNDGDPKTSGPGFLATEHPDTLTDPLSWRKPRKVFVNSMSDLFHERIGDEFIARVFAVMAAASTHTFQVLTKRHGRMRSLLSDPEFVAAVRRERYKLPHTVVTTGPSWPLLNVWLGVSVEDQKWANTRIPALLDTPAAVRFLSCEPLLGPVDLTPWTTWGDGSLRYDEPPVVSGLRWVIAGGESGDGFRPVDGEWVRALRDQCVEAEVAFLFKQWGGRTPKAGGRELDGRTWDEYPSVVWVGGGQ